MRPIRIYRLPRKYFDSVSILIRDSVVRQMRVKIQSRNVIEEPAFVPPSPLV